MYCKLILCLTTGTLLSAPTTLTVNFPTVRPGQFYPWFSEDYIETSEKALTSHATVQFVTKMRNFKSFASTDLIVRNTRRLRLPLRIA